jgi:hypothetical protein
MTIQPVSVRTQVTMLQLHQPSLGTWTRIQLSHIIPVDNNNHIFLKAVTAIQCLNLDYHIKQSTHAPAHSFYQNLPHKCAYVHCKTIKKQEQTYANKKVAKSKPLYVKVTSASDYGMDAKLSQ